MMVAELRDLPPPQQRFQGGPLHRKDNTMKTSLAILCGSIFALTGCGGGTPTPIETVTVEIAPTPVATDTTEISSAPAENEVETTAPTEAEVAETDDNVFADNADYEAHRSDLFSVLAPIWGDSMADDLVHAEDSMFRDEGLRQMCVIWQSGVRVTSEDEADENMRQVYLSTGASDERAAALVSSLKQNVCTK